MNGYLLLIFLVLAGCTPPREAKEHTYEPDGNLRVIEDAYHFYVLGDWGRNGDYKQRELATMMNKVTRVIEPEIIISTGDNFYPDGIASVQDPYWISSFENIYSGHGLFVPWYVILGNHDYRGNYQAEIDYTSISQRWNMPAQYYTKTIDEDGISARFVFIDTSPFEDKYYSEEKYKAVWSQDSTRQLIWMDSVMSSNTSDRLIVVGHHPLYSGGKRLHETQDVRGHLEKVLRKHEPDLYFAGHEHDLQHIKPDYATHHVISGAGSEVRPTAMMDISLFAQSIQGFVIGSISPEVILLQFVSYKGELLYSYTIK